MMEKNYQLTLFSLVALLLSSSSFLFDVLHTVTKIALINFVLFKEDTFPLIQQI